jgi:hypothetical protein
MRKIYSLIGFCLSVGSMSAHADDLVFPKDVSCGPVGYTGPTAWITERDNQRVVVLKRPLGNYLCDVSSESTGRVTCKSLGEPVGLMPNQLNVVYSHSHQHWVIIVDDTYHFLCQNS